MRAAEEWFLELGFSSLTGVLVFFVEGVHFVPLALWEKYPYSHTFHWKWILRLFNLLKSTSDVYSFPNAFKKHTYKKIPLLLLTFCVMPLSLSTVVERNFIWNIHNKSIANYHFNNVLWSVSMQSSGKAHMPWNLGLAVYGVCPLLAFPQVFALGGRRGALSGRMDRLCSGLRASFVPVFIATVSRVNCLWA